MIKKLSTIAVAALIALPTAASAGGMDDLAAQIEQLSKELNRLKQEMAQIKEQNTEVMEEIDEKSEKWDFASRIQLSGDFRSMLTGVSAGTPSHWQAMDVGSGVADFLAMGRVVSRYDADNGGGQDLNAFNPDWGAFAAAGYDTATSLGGSTNITDTESAAVQRAMGSAAFAAILGGFPGATPLSTLGGMFSSAQTITDFMKGNSGVPMTALTRNTIFQQMGYNLANATDYENDSILTNRVRLNIRAKATENVEFKGRFAMYKAWGMQNNPVDSYANGGMGGGPFMLNSLSFDGNTSRQPGDNKLVVDRALINWNEIADLPVWLSIGRRPTTDGPPAQLRLGADKKMATPVNYMDYPFDGATIGYAYENFFGMEDFPGRVRFCYGRGFEAGPAPDNAGLRDVDFAGINWDVYNSGDRFFNIQSFGAFDMFNVPDNVTFVNPIEYYTWQIDPTQFDPTDPSKNLQLDRANLGNIYHTSAVYMSKFQNLNYFLVGGWSRTKAEGMDEMGTSLLGSFWDTPENKNGYSFYAGLRYDIPNKPFKVGLEYNHGTKNWISFTPGNDELYASKLATRGDVIEAYTIWDIPAGEAISKLGRAFVRLGYQHYEYDYTGSGFWLGEPLDIDQLASDPLRGQFYTPVDSQDQLYLSLEAWF